MTLAGGGQHGRGREAKEGGNGRGQGSWRSSAFHSVTTHRVSASAPIHLESVSFNRWTTVHIYVQNTLTSIFHQGLSTGME